MINVKKPAAQAMSRRIVDQDPRPGDVFYSERNDLIVFIGRDKATLSLSPTDGYIRAGGNINDWADDYEKVDVELIIKRRS